MNKEELLKIMKFTQEEIASKESLIKELEENFSSDNIDAKNTVGFIFLHLLTLRQKERVEQFCMSTLDRIDQLEAENKKMRELLFDIVENQQEFSHGDYFCRICGTELNGYHSNDCPITKIEFLLEETKVFMNDKNIDEILTDKDRLQRAEELLKLLVEHSKQSLFSGNFENIPKCVYCAKMEINGVLLHLSGCPVEEAESFLAEVDNE